MNTFGIDAKANFYTEVADIQQLKQVFQDEKWTGMSKLILGGGSNVLFTDDYQGLVVRMAIEGAQVIHEDEEAILVKVGAGHNWHQFVLYAIGMGFGGVENLSFIPGTVGAAPMQNIGAYGVEVESVFHALEALNIESGDMESFSREECNFGYRQSIFKNTHKGRYVITHVTFKLTKNHVLNTSYGAIQQTLEESGITAPTIKDVSEAVIKIRSSKLPNPDEIGNAGSFFKNPVIESQAFQLLKSSYEQIPNYPAEGQKYKVPAAWLIEQAGWKGKRRGDIGVHDKQALVLVNHGNGMGKDLVALSSDIQTSVKAKFGVLLEPEVNII